MTGLRFVLAGLLIGVLAACTTVTQGPDGREIATPSEPPDPVRRAQARLELATAYYGRAQYKTALDEIKAALAAKPDLADAYALRGLVQAGMGDMRLADESFQRAIQLAPQDGGHLHNYAWHFCQQQRYAEADVLFERALAQPQYRDSARTLLARGVCQARATQWAEAERSLARSYELDPSNPVTAYNLADVLMRRGELERARFYVRRINAVPELMSAQSLWLAARIERRVGNLEALKDLGKQLRERYPQASETFQFESGRFDD
ncbi:Pilus assembly protein PilW [Rubrivivax sp. A210]|uniref:type IV pilus biogenesis/stability protein PilW n=1 Tax=Rubrivivax sp. A210 TaxID=2772301 RepID=UPI00191A71CE|nr:type IV pilus biogenesis/stability protein PilW [Rubrivivax sp. A210]CAD5367338.1 Pilus assembly protein PilW [Rubrivivax sp. A210]